MHLVQIKLSKTQLDIYIRKRSERRTSVQPSISTTGALAVKRWQIISYSNNKTSMQQFSNSMHLHKTMKIFRRIQQYHKCNISRQS